MDLQADDELSRRIHGEAFNRTEHRITSAAFKTGGEYDESISVYVAKLLDHDPHRVIEDRPYHGIAVLTVGAVNALGFDVVYDPDPNDTTLGHAHAVIVGINNRATSKQLAQQARLVIPPPVRPE